MYFLHGSGLLLIVGNILDLDSSWQNTHICSEANESLMKRSTFVWLLCSLQSSVYTQPKTMCKI